MNTKINVTVDDSKFDRLQFFLVGELVKRIRLDLEHSGIKSEKLADLTKEIAFSVTSVIDASSRMALDGETVRPFLTFAMDEDAVELLATRYCTSMHEYAVGVAEELFEDD